MNTTTASLRGNRAKGLRIISVGGFMLASLGAYAAAEQEETEGQLPQTTVIANRVETDLAKVGSSVTVLDAKKLDQQGIRELDDALKFVPGVISDTSSGQRGTTSSVFIRGNLSDYTGLIVDGIHMDGGGFGSSFAAGNFFGISNINGISRVEVLRGPQGVLYGASFVSGAIGLSSAKGEGNFSGGLRVEGGSFNSWNTLLGLQGETGKFSYSLSLGHEETDNDLPNNTFDAFSYTLRLDYAASDNLRFGLTTRGVNSETQLPDYADPAYPLKTDVEFDYNLSTFFAEYDVNDRWSSKLTLGYYDENYQTTRSSTGALSFISEANKFAAYWDNTITWNNQHSTVAGIAYDKSHYMNGSVAEKTRSQTGVYVNHVWDVTDRLNLTAGARWTNYKEDDLNGFNDNIGTWRVSGSYTVDQTNSTIRASAGTGYQLPTFYQIYRRTPNNVLNPAESIGWDLGIEQPFCDGQYKLGVTYFATRVENSIDYIRWDNGPIYGNRAGINETSGVEAFAEGHFLDERITATIAYTWLDQQSLAAPHFLAENTLSVRIDAKVSDKLNLGLTSTYQGHRALFGQPLDDYALVNLYANYKLNDNVTLNARVDNLLDKDYFHGVSGATGGTIRPGRGLGIFAGVTINW